MNHTKVGTYFVSDRRKDWLCRYEWSAQRLKWALVSYVCSNQNIDQKKQMERVRGMIEKEYNRDREREGVIR